MEITQKKRPRIIPYGFSVIVDWNDATPKDDIIPLILFWIFENMGPYDSTRWQMRHAMGTKKFLSIYFSDPVDASAFKLRWM